MFVVYIESTYWTGSSVGGEMGESSPLYNHWNEFGISASGGGNSGGRGGNDSGGSLGNGGQIWK